MASLFSVCRFAFSGHCVWMESVALRDWVLSLDITFQGASMSRPVSLLPSVAECLLCDDILSLFIFCGHSMFVSFSFRSRLSLFCYSFFFRFATPQSLPHVLESGSCYSGCSLLRWKPVCFDFLLVNGHLLREDFCLSQFFPHLSPSCPLAL